MKSIIPEYDSPYTIDECKIRGYADKVWFPENASDVSEILKKAVENNIQVTVNASRTGMCGGGVPYGGWVMSMESMPGLIGIGYDNGYFARIGPSLTVEKLNDALLSFQFDGVSDITENACSQLKNHGRCFYPVDPTETASTVCGNIATDASGPRTFRYGSTRKHVKSITVVIPSGELIKIDRGKYFANGKRMKCSINSINLDFQLPKYNFDTSIKNTTGLYSKENMDLIDLFIGSEGILGVIVEAEVRLSEWHPTISTIAFMPDDDSALNLISAIKNKLSPDFLEYFDTGSISLAKNTSLSDSSILSPPEGKSAVFTDFDEKDVDGLKLLSELIIEYGGSMKDTWVGINHADRKRMFSFRHCVPKSIFEYVASLKEDIPKIHKMGTDMSVPDSESKEMIEFYINKLKQSNLEYVIFGHLGNSHPHVEIILKDENDLKKASVLYDEFASEAIKRGGSPSAEHGIGKLKKKYIKMMYGDEGIEDIRSVKRVFDPSFILNGGDMID